MGGAGLQKSLRSHRVRGLIFIGLIILIVLALNLPSFVSKSSARLDIASTDNQTFLIAKYYESFKSSEIVEIKQGEFNALILTKDGSVYISGSNKYGQLGAGTFGGNHTEFKKIAFPEEIRIKQIDLTHRHALALTSNGDVWAWGMNLSGQVGNGSHSDVNKPTKVFSDAVQVAAGYRFSAALKENGQLWAWGMQCDPNTEGLEELAASFAHDITIGGSYYDGRSDTDLVYCLEQENLPINSTKPRLLSSDHKFTSVSAGYGHLLMLDDKQTGWGFGCNGWGQLGRGHFRNDSGTRTITKLYFPKGTQIKQLSAGYRHGVALDTNNKLWSWGHDTQGEITDVVTYKSNRTDSPEVLPSQPPEIIGARAGHDATGVLTERHFHVIGSNEEGQISPEARDISKFVFNTFSEIGPAKDFSLGYVRHIYW